MATTTAIITMDIVEGITNEIATKMATENLEKLMVEGS